MAKLYKADGSMEELVPEDEGALSLQQMQSSVGGYIEILRMDNGDFIVVNEDGISIGLPRNEAATRYFHTNCASRIPGDYIKGNMIVCSREELGE